ncbi:DUF2188 domain-containing protein [Luteibacter yeojuensis]|uniref:DUF2188 domain-containing protein n=1 Tax=Luteibacter yeojuensis TaxID=345309 RepID=A0A0F3KZ18_9GAMM|nr:DUF2188 domain-containing protein [Luteibacter yeojuensis]KJV36406.1 hypothetical protein VI08_04590 [Luteibacter yeojuensis]
MASSSAQLFIPYSESAQGPWIVRRDASAIGSYGSQADAVHAAEALAPGLSDSLGRPVAIHVQNADGTWEEHTWVVAGMVAGAPASPRAHAL